ncbi:MAG: arginase family protein, partial [Anaerolineales bacterium]|nr:arginase family protein [Anaerolineales bacterium]
MRNKYILTPYFLDRPEPGLRPLARPGWQRNAPALPVGSPQEQLVHLYRPLAAQVAAAVRAGERPVSVAGDCCAALGVLTGLEQAGVRPALIWFDAHGDFNTWETTPSGFLGGMPLAMAVGHGDQTLVQGLGLTPLDEADVILTDARDLDAGERLSLAASAVRHVPDVAALLTEPLPPGSLYVHFDADVLRIEDAPAMSYPAAGGPPLETLRQVFARLADTGRVTAVSLSAWNPALDGDGRSRKVVMGMLAE